jgi:hypothetical protein
MTRFKRFLARVTLSDVGIVLGLGLCDYALFQWASVAGWLFLGIVVVVLSVILDLSPGTRASSGADR